MTCTELMTVYENLTYLAVLLLEEFASAVVHLSMKTMASMAPPTRQHTSWDTSKYSARTFMGNFRLNLGAIWIVLVGPDIFCYQKWHFTTDGGDIQVLKDFLINSAAPCNFLKFIIRSIISADSPTSSLLARYITKLTALVFWCINL